MWLFRRATIFYFFTDSGDGDFNKSETIDDIPTKVLKRFTKSDGKWFFESRFGVTFTANMPKKPSMTTGSLTFKASTKAVQEVVKDQLLGDYGLQSGAEKKLEALMRLVTIP